MNRSLGQLNMSGYAAIRDESISSLFALNLVDIYRYFQFQMIKWSNQIYQLEADVWDTFINRFSVLWNISITLL